MSVKKDFSRVTGRQFPVTDAVAKEISNDFLYRLAANIYSKTKHHNRLDQLQILQTDNGIRIYEDFNFHIAHKQLAHIYTAQAPDGDWWVILENNYLENPRTLDAIETAIVAAIREKIAAEESQRKTRADTFKTLVRTPIPQDIIKSIVSSSLGPAPLPAPSGKYGKALNILTKKAGGSRRRRRHYRTRRHTKK